MKKFEVPELNVVILAAEDIITGSTCDHDCKPNGDNCLEHNCRYEGPIA